MQKGKKTTGWLILQLACLGFLVASMGTISNQDSTQLLLMVMVSCPIIATLPALLYIPKHPLVWMYCGTLFNIGVIAFSTISPVFGKRFSQHPTAKLYLGGLICGFPLCNEKCLSGA
ncbi:MAG: hypothetical protein II349_01545 [Akkermansia sp.]|nr:hypothetical protein [Akkermansia sp.]